MQPSRIQDQLEFLNGMTKSPMLPKEKEENPLDEAAVGST